MIKKCQKKKKRWKNGREVTSTKRKIRSENVTTGNIQKKLKAILKPAKENTEENKNENKKPVASAEKEESAPEIRIEEEIVMEKNEKETTEPSKASEEKTEENQLEKMDVEGEN